MSIIKYWPVYEGGQQQHLPYREVLRILRVRPESMIISDQMAQTIAAQWHSPARPYSTRLSTMGMVDLYATLEDFGTEAECGMEADRRALRALGAYITAKQAAAPSGAYPCACDDCQDIQYGRRGELCKQCADALCDPAEHAACERDDAYGDSETCPACGQPMDYCPGHGQIGDPEGFHILAMHEAGDHSRCHAEHNCD